MGAEPLVLVNAGQGRAAIILASKPSSSAKVGAGLLSAQLERISGAKLPVLGEEALAGSGVESNKIRGTFKGREFEAFILVGESRLAGLLGVTADGLGAGGVRVRTCANALVLLGSDERTPSDTAGSRYAVTTFLEEALGFRMLWPGELGFVAPLRRTVAVPPLDIAFTPPIVQRRIRNSHYNDRLQVGLDYLGVLKAEYERVEAVTLGGDSRLPNWFAWQRLGGEMDVTAGHAFGYAWEKYHREHPEWFAQQPNGSRDLSKLTPARSRLCKANLALIDALAADTVADLARSGGRSASLCPNDGGLATFCMCPACKRLDPPEGRPVTLSDNSSGPRRAFEYVSLTDRMVWFWNRLTERITAQVPGARLAVYAYSCYKAPPVREKLHPSLAVGFVGMSYASELERQQALADWEAWSKATGTLYWRPNLLLLARREGVPALYAHKLGEDLARFARQSLKGTDFDSCCHNWATEGLNYYVLAQLLWKPDASVDAILDDYCKSGFGQGWHHVRRYFERVEALTDAVAAKASPITAPYTPETVAELCGLLDAAREADADATVRRRVAFLRRGLTFAALQQQAYAFLDAHADKALSAEDKAQIMALQQAKWTFMRTSFREEPLAVNMPMVAWGGEGLFRKYGWKGAANATQVAVDADEEGRVVRPQGK
jgi:hypothetical protein